MVNSVCIERRRSSLKVKVGLTWSCIARDQETKVRFSGLTCPLGEDRYWQKSYPRGNGIIPVSSTYLHRCLLLRCRLSLSRKRKGFQGLV